MDKSLPDVWLYDKVTLQLLGTAGTVEMQVETEVQQNWLTATCLLGHSDKSGEVCTQFQKQLYKQSMQGRAYNFYSLKKARILLIPRQMFQ